MSQVMVFQNGRIVEAGPTRQVMAEPREDYTRQLLQSVPKLVMAQPRVDITV